MVRSPKTRAVSARMATAGKLSLLLATLGVVLGAVAAKITDEAAATQFLADLDPEYIRAANKQMKARWEYITNVNEANSNAQVNLVSINVQKAPAIVVRGKRYLTRYRVDNGRLSSHV